MPGLLVKSESAQPETPDSQVQIPKVHRISVDNMLRPNEPDYLWIIHTYYLPSYCRNMEFNEQDLPTSFKFIKDGCRVDIHCSSSDALQPVNDWLVKQVTDKFGGSATFVYRVATQDTSSWFIYALILLGLLTLVLESTVGLPIVFHG